MEHTNIKVFYNVTGMWEWDVLVVFNENISLHKGKKKTPKYQKEKCPLSTHANGLLVPSCHKGHDGPYCTGSKVHEKQVCKWQVVAK